MKLHGAVAIVSALVIAMCAAMIFSCSSDDDDDNGGSPPVDQDDDSAVDDDASSDDDASTDGDAGDGDQSNDDGTIKVWGHAFGFPEYEMIANATITVLEMPDRSTVTDADGYWEFDDMPVDEQATFVMEHDKYHLIQTKTFTLPDTELEKVTFQAPINLVFNLLALGLGVDIDDSKCQIVTTVTVVGKSIYDEGPHGEEGATVTIEPAVDPSLGPIYFNSDVLPDPDLTETSDDGGVLYVNAPVGEYDLYAHKEGVDFISPHMKCRAGLLVNASPPYGLQALEDEE